jgi:phosphoesterase RecJ-like protein
MGTALADLKTSHDQRIAWIEITPQVLRQARAKTAPSAQVASSLCTIQGVDVGVTFEEGDAGRTMVEIRSRGAVDVSTIARSLGGGGHRSAGGCTLDVPMARARDLVLGRVRQAMLDPA